jgi:hypothetical protein
MWVLSSVTRLYNKMSAASNLIEVSITTLISGIYFAQKISCNKSVDWLTWFRLYDKKITISV